jgi:hypothetical protein
MQSDRKHLCSAAGLRLVLLGVVAQAVTACSVGLALHGEDPPDLSVLKAGTPKTQIESKLGPPDSEAILADGRTQSTYAYEVGNESSAGRAGVHAAMDILTLGVWELVGTPLEAMQGEEMRVVITYDGAGNAETFDVAKSDDAADSDDGGAPSSRHAATRPAR